MHVDYIKAAVAVFEARSYTTAAPVFGLTPEGLLKRVRTVEKELGYRLFKKGFTNHVLPTEQGREYLFYARLALDLLERGGRVAVEVGKDGKGV